VMIIKMALFWDIAPYSLVDIDSFFIALIMEAVNSLKWHLVSIRLHGATS
jgi:hypothetical protein